MAQKIDLTSPEQRELFGLDATVTKPSQQTRRSHDYSRRGGRDTMQIILQSCHHREMTRSGIAKALDRAKTPYLVAMIERMVDDGYLERREATWINGVTMYKYIAR